MAARARGMLAELMTVHLRMGVIVCFDSRTPRGTAAECKEASGDRRTRA